MLNGPFLKNFSKEESLLNLFRYELASDEKGASVVPQWTKIWYTLIRNILNLGKSCRDFATVLTMKISRFVRTCKIFAWVLRNKILVTPEKDKPWHGKLHQVLKNEKHP